MRSLQPLGMGTMEAAFPSFMRRCLSGAERRRPASCPAGAGALVPGAQRLFFSAFSQAAYARSVRLGAEKREIVWEAVSDGAFAQVWFAQKRIAFAAKTGYSVRESLKFGSLPVYKWRTT